MWVARDENGDLYIHGTKPERCLINDTDNYLASLTGHFMKIDNHFFPFLDWKDEPIEVEIVKKEKV